MARRTCEVIIPVEYDDEMTDDESIAVALDILLETATSTPGIWDDYGPVAILPSRLEQRGLDD